MALRHKTGQTKRHVVEKLVDRLKRSPMIILFGVVLVLLSSTITTLDFCSRMFAYYHATTFGYRRDLLRTLSTLAPGVDINNFLGRPFGMPTFDNYLKENKVESIFVNRLCYIQVIWGGGSSRVLGYSVTTRDKNFNPAFTLGSFHVTLGKTTFAELDGLGEPPQIRSFIGTSRYSEVYNFGNSGIHETFVASINDAGYQKATSKEVGNVVQRQLGDSTLKAFRKEAVINTYTVTAPFVSVEDLNTGIGPSYTQVRILPGS